MDGFSAASVRKGEGTGLPDWRVLTVLLVASTLTVMSGATIAPSLPGLANHFSDVPNAEFLARLALTLPALSIAISAPIMGLLVDRYGARRILFWSTALYVIAGGSGAVAPELYSLLAGRALLGLAVAGVMTATTTLIGALFSSGRRDGVLGYQGAAMAVGGVVFLSAGGLLAEIGWRLPFLIYAAPVLLLPFIVTGLPRAEPEANETSFLDPMEAAPWLRLSGVYLVAIAAMALFYVIPTQVPFLLNFVDLKDASLAGYAIAVSTFASAVTSLLFGRIKSAIPASGALAATFLALGLGLALAGASDDFFTIAAAMLLAGAGAGLTVPTLSSLMLDLTPAHSRGRATGGLSMSLFLGQFLSPVLLVALSPGETIAESFLWAGAASVLSGASFLIALALIRIHARRSTKRAKP